MKFIMYSLSQQEEIERRADNDEDHEREHEILLDTTCLNSPQFTTKPVCHICSAIAEETVDDRQVKFCADEGAKSASSGTEDVQDAINEAFIHPGRDEDFRNPDRRFDKEEVIDLIKVVFVLEKTKLEFIFRW